MRAAERHLHLCVCRACRCREEVQATSHHWAAKAVFLFCSAGEATLRGGAVLFCIYAPNGVSRRRVIAVRRSCPSLHEWSLSFVFFAGPLPAVPHWEATHF
ncbi:hypothetical protein TcCL_ESM08437 [Trypanosoma cruzi]|nr:hypothetical protein TcCL_ESM08437 [Trypanosoma cruzi]